MQGWDRKLWLSWISNTEWRGKPRGPKWSPRYQIGQSVTPTQWRTEWILLLSYCLAVFFDVFHQSVACSNNLAASLAWCSQLVFQFFFCLDRHHCSTQGWFCATNPLSPTLPSLFPFKFHWMIFSRVEWTKYMIACKLHIFQQLLIVHLDFLCYPPNKAIPWKL